MGRPVLWHIPVSHYSEKARWALDHKGVEHDRRTPPPPSQLLVSPVLTRGRSRTYPVLQLDGRGIGDSTAIIAALEERFPDRPLYPADAAERRRALELEEHFDEEVGPYTRRLAFFELRRDREGITDFATSMLPEPLRAPAARAGIGRFAAAFSAVRYGAGDAEGAEAARTKIRAGFDRLETGLERGGGAYLVGDTLSVADVTAASLFAPLVNPPEGPGFPAMPEAYDAFRRTLEDRPGFRWVADIFARHRVGARRP